MSCIAGVGGDVPPLVAVAKSGRDIIVLDGCPLQCAKQCLARHNVKPTLHYTLSDFGVPKRVHKDPNPTDTEKIFRKVLEDLSCETSVVESREVA
jgi:uncharacterized metal-binding protein